MRYKRLQRFPMIVEYFDMKSLSKHSRFLAGQLTRMFVLEALIAGAVFFGVCSCESINDKKTRNIDKKEDRYYSPYKKRDFYLNERYAGIVYDSRGGKHV